MTRTKLFLAPLFALALVAGGCGDDEEDPVATGDTAAEGTEAATEGGGGAIAVGSADFAESQIAASMYAQVLENGGYDVTEESGIGARDVYFPALEGGEIDVVPEFVGTLVAFLEGEPSSGLDEAVSTLEGLLPEGIIALEPAEAESTNVFVVTQETADEFGLETVSDLADRVGELTLGGPPECPERPFCLIGLRDTYGADFTERFTPLDAGGPLTKSALEGGEIDVALLFSTDGSILENDWVVLEDDEELQPADNVLPVGREEALDAEAQELLNGVSEALTDEAYRELNRRVGVDQEDAEDVATEFLEDNDLL